VNGATTRDTGELVVAICAAIAGGSSMDKACKEHGSSSSSFWRAIHGDPLQLERYEAALMARAERHAGQIVELADERPPIHEGRYDGAYVQWQRNRIDARKWVAARLLPKRYGDRVEVTGPDGGPILVVRDLTGKPAARDRSPVIEAELVNDHARTGSGHSVLPLPASTGPAPLEAGVGSSSAGQLDDTHAAAKTSQTRATPPHARNSAHPADSPPTAQAHIAVENNFFSAAPSDEKEK
jgi:hypothetical protein